MVPTQDPALLFGLHAFPSLDYLPAGVVGLVLAACAVALVAAAARRHDTE